MKIPITPKASHRFIPTSYTEHVAYAIEEYNHSYIPTLTNMADLLEISETTLKRRLKQEGISFSNILNRKLAKKAQYLLLNTQKSVRQIGEELGYANASNFVRAFLRWEGITPDTYRGQYRPKHLCYGNDTRENLT